MVLVALQQTDTSVWLEIHWHIVAISVAATYNPLLEYMHEALEQEHKGVPMLALVQEPEDLNKEPEPTVTLPAPGGGGELGLGLGHGHGLDRGGSTGKTAR